MTDMRTGWHPDPWQLHELRYFGDDGRATMFVSDGGAVTNDPPPDPTSAPTAAQGPGQIAEAVQAANAVQVLQPLPPPGWYADPADVSRQRYWDGQAWTERLDQWTPAPRSIPVRRSNQRMARRIAKRAGANEQGVAVCFAYNNLLTCLLIGAVEDVARFVPTIGDLIVLMISLVTFYFHRIVLVTDQNVCVYRDWPFHIPGKLLAVYPRHYGVVGLGSPNPGGFSGFIRRGQLNFQDGLVVYHGILWIRRAEYIVQEGNRPAGS